MTRGGIAVVVILAVVFCIAYAAAALWLSPHMATVPTRFDVCDRDHVRLEVTVVPLAPVVDPDMGNNWHENVIDVWICGGSE